MRKTAIIISIAAALLTQVSCVGNKTEQSKTDTIAVSGPNKTAINDMSEYNLDGTVEVGGTKYSYEFAFQNDPSQPVVTTAEGYRYHDNAVLLIIRNGQETIFEHRFTKESFQSLIPAADYKRSVLAGFNFNYMQQDKHDRFYFIAVVGDPDETSDISYSIGIAIDRSGGIATSIVETIDTEPINNDLNQDPDEDDA
ncbi:MAG: DUF4738 domain-containing protein [Bacteroidaceae bacterium]|nr:DUF4738 domain-containing protein [Bacteroidaceae bacterium]